MPPAVKIILQILLQLVLIALNAVFACAEIAVIETKGTKLDRLADDGNKRAKGVMFVLGKFDKALTTLLIGNNVTKIAGAAVFTILCTDIFEQDILQ